MKVKDAMHKVDSGSPPAFPGKIQKDRPWGRSMTPLNSGVGSPINYQVSS